MKPYQKHNPFLGLVVSSILLTACAPLSSKLHLGPKLGIKIPIEDASFVTEESVDGIHEDGGNAPLKFSQLDNTDVLENDVKALKNKKYIGSGKFISKKPASDTKKPSTGGKYSLNFDAADLGEVAKIILSDMLQENYVMSSKVRGSVTLQTTHPLHKDELLPTLEMLLRVNDAVIVKRDGLYRIEPNAKGAQIAGSSGIGGKMQSGYQIKIIPLQYVGAIDMAEIITPVVPNKSIIKVDPARNILFVAGTKDELTKILDLVDTFDVNFIAGMSFGLFPLENTDASTTITEIEEIFNKGEKTPLSGMLRFITIKHLNAILVVTQQKAYLREAEKWITRLDIASEAVGEGGVIVYRVQHVDAVELAATLSEIVSGSSSSSSRKPSVAPGRKVASISNKSRTTPKRTSRTSGKGASSLEGVNIIADEANNALVIMAEPQQYKTLNKIIKQLDVMPLQVLIDAMIVSVTLTDELQHGVQWRFNNQLGDFRGFGQSSNVSGLSIIQNVTDFAAKGFSYGLVGTDLGVKATFNALAKDNKINVISTPSVMVLNNHEATIKVGLEVPTRGAESTNINGGGNLTTSPIERIETGVTLTVKPRVNASGVVIMEIDQKVNEVSDAKSGSQIDSPTILKREITSSVAITSGESVVLGGLMNETHSYDNEGIPLLKDIPYLGWVFGTQGKKVRKEELVIIITPRVIQNKIDARKVTNEFKRKLTGIFYSQDEYKLKWDEVDRDSTGREVKHRQFRD